MKQLIFVVLLAALVNSSLMPVEVKEEPPTANIKVNEENVKPDPKKKEVYTYKVFETEAEGYDLVKNTFKNVVLWVYESDDQDFQALLEQSLTTLNPKESGLDIIFLKSSLEKFPQRKPGLHIRHLGNDVFVDLTYPLDQEELTLTIKEHVAPSLRTVSKPEATQFLQGEGVKLLLLMDSSDPLFPKVKTSFENQLKEGTFQEAGVDEVRHLDLPQFRSFSSPSLLLYKPNSPIERYDNNITYFDQITDFIYLESLPIVVPLNSEYYARVFGGSINTQLHLLIDEKQDNKELLAQYRKAAIHNKEHDLKYERLIFTYSNFEDNRDLWTQFDYTESTPTPQVVVTKTNFRKFQLEKYVYDEPNLQAEDFGRFLERFRERNVVQFYRSEPIPDEPEKDGVVKVVGKTFIQEIIKGRQNTLVLFWDSKNPDVSVAHEEVLRSIGKELPEDKREFIKIVTFDLALNEHPSITIDSAPQVYLYLAGDKRRPKNYNLDIASDQIKAWLSYWIVDLELVQFKPEGGYTVVDLEKYKEEKKKQAEEFAKKQAELMAKLQAEAEARSIAEAEARAIAEEKERVEAELKASQGDATLEQNETEVLTQPLPLPGEPVYQTDAKSLEDL